MMFELNRKFLVNKIGNDRLLNLDSINLRYSDISKIISKIDSNTFKDPTKLETLKLEHNLIGELDVRLFESLSNLQSLSMSNNKLKIIDRKCFEPLRSIEVIDLFENICLNALSYVKPSTQSSNRGFKYNSRTFYFYHFI